MRAAWEGTASVQPSATFSLVPWPYGLKALFLSTGWLFPQDAQVETGPDTVSCHPSPLWPLGQSWVWPYRPVSVFHFGELSPEVFSISKWLTPKLHLGDLSPRDIFLSGWPTSHFFPKGLQTLCKSRQENVPKRAAPTTDKRKIRVPAFIQQDHPIWIRMDN